MARRSQVCYKIDQPDRCVSKSNSELRETSSGTLGTCRCSKLCYRTKERDGCTDRPPNDSNSSVSNAVRESSSQALGACRCSKLCYMTKERDGCTDRLPNGSSSSVSNAVKESSSQALGACRCSKLCHMTKERDGCTDRLPNCSSSSVSNAVKESSSQALGACRCSKLCHMTKERDGCTDRLPTRSNSSVRNAVKESSSQALGACRCSKLCHLTKERDGCTDSLPDGSNTSVSTGVRETSSEALKACHCSKLFKQRDGSTHRPPTASGTTRNELRDDVSGALETCRRSKQCYKTKGPDRYRGRPPNDSTSSSSSDDLRQTSSGGLGTCRCSKLCHMTKERDGCTDIPPSSSNLRKDSSGALGNCRCSKLCYMTKERDGCTDSLPTSSSGTLTACRCSQLRFKSSSGTGDAGNQNRNVVDPRDTKSPSASCPCSRTSYRPPSSDLKSNASSGLGSCQCSRLLEKSVKYSNYVQNPPKMGDGKNTGSSDTKESTGAPLANCLCFHLSNVPERGSERADSSSQNFSTPSSCYCSVSPTSDTVGASKQAAAAGSVNEPPVKEPRPDASSEAAACGCEDPANCVDLNAFSLDSTDLKYLQQVKLLTQQDHKLKCELENLAAQEAAMRSTIKSCDQAVYGEKVTGDDDLKTLRSINKELTSLNENLTDKVQDLHLELDQLSQRISGPMTRELERARKKYVEIRSEMNRYKQCECIGTTSDKLSLMSGQLEKTQENIADMALVNDGIKQEVAVLECKCRNMEDILIKQKVDEIDTINKLQTSDKDLRDASVANSVIEKGDVSETPSCSCSDF